MEHTFKSEQLPSGKFIFRHYDGQGVLKDEMHSYVGSKGIAIRHDFQKGVKVAETYHIKNRMVSRSTYEKARVDFPDMPSADQSIKDLGSALRGMVRKQQRQRKKTAEERLAQSAESRFPAPDSTNWLRIITDESSHLVLFASRDWKLLCSEPRIPSGRAWLDAFGFSGPSNVVGTVMDGLVTGYEVVGDRQRMLDTSQQVVKEVTDFVENPPHCSQWSSLIKRKKPNRMPPFAWSKVLPPLIDYLSCLTGPTVTIFNHHK